jgi:hypothetical protein
LAAGQYGSIVSPELAQQIERQEQTGAAQALLTDALRQAPTAVLNEELRKVAGVPAVQVYLQQVR